MTRPLNFIHLTTFYPPYSFGGDAMYIYRLAHALGDRGHHVDVVHCVDSYKLLHPAEPELDFAEHPRVTRHELRSAAGRLSPLLTQQTGRPLLKRRKIQTLLDSRRYDVVQFHNTSLLGPTVLRMEPRDGRCVKLYMAHEHWLVCPAHVLWKFNSRPCEKPECLRCVVHSKRPPQLWRYTGLLEECAKHVDLFVTPSVFASKMHAERGFSRPVEHLPYFIDRVDDEWKNPGPRPHERPYFLFVGRLEKLKGLQTLIGMWDRIPQADLLVAGAGTSERALKEQAAGLPSVKFLGPLPQRELGRLYYHAVACVVPSVTYETFGIIIVEAFARKTPVIVRDLGALPEVVDAGGGGIVYRSDDELAGALLELLESPARRAELGEKGYEAFVRLWSREAHLDRYFEFLEQTSRAKFGEVIWAKESGDGGV